MLQQCNHLSNNTHNERTPFAIQAFKHFGNMLQLL